MKETDLRKQLGLHKKTIKAFNWLGLTVSVVVIGAFLWQVLVLSKGPLMYYLSESIGSLCAIFGIVLFLNGKGITGLLLVLMHVAQIVITRVIYSMSFLKSPYFWLFSAVSVVFAIVFFAPFVRTKPK